MRKERVALISAAYLRRALLLIVMEGKDSGLNMVEGLPRTWLWA